MSDKKYILAFDTANESISIAIGEVLDGEIQMRASFVSEAHRASNTLLIPNVEKLVTQAGISKSQIAYVAAGRGPGSFTGVRIALATAKGIGTALSIPLIGFNTLDAIAWKVWADGKRGHAYVVADAMRHEIYPALYKINEAGIERLSENCVLKAEDVATEAKALNSKCDNLFIVGDALVKHYTMFEDLNVCDKRLWVPDGASLLKASEASLKNKITNASNVLPVYTRLSDAEENERKKLANINEKNLTTGVNDLNNEIVFAPMDAAVINQIENLESELMQSDAWNANKINDELSQNNRSWWTATKDNKVIAYGGAMHVDNKMELLKIAVSKHLQKNGLAKQILSKIANDMRDLGAKSMILEVRQSNEQAINLYERLGARVLSTRKNYYSDGEDAIVMEGPLPIISSDVAGMDLIKNQNAKDKTFDKPVIFSIESSCDETACAITANGNVVCDVVASQIDFHKRFGGVVPEIASRKHIEAICGVADECMDQSGLDWTAIDAIAVTYAPGLVGALVVGMAFAKGLSFALDIPLIGINHLEGHMYANKLNAEEIKLPAIASLISGGNTQLVLIEDWGKYKTLGTTIDDAVGEAFDKVSKYLGLGYPGGPIISKLAKDGNPKAIDFPRAMMHTKDYDFSLSGLKTAVITHIEKHKDDKHFNLNDLCASFEQAIIDVQVHKAKEAIKQTGAKSFMFGGGVAANPQIRAAYEKMCDKAGVKLIMAPLSACGDNAVMIGLVANDRFKQNKFLSLDADVAAHAPLDEEY